MKYSKAMLALLAASVLPLAANAASDAERDAFEQRYAIIDSGVATIDTVRSAVLSSYVKHNAWPNVNSLVSDGYIRTLRSSWGNNVNGLVSGGGNSYTISMIAPSPEMAQGIAARLGGVAAGSSVQVLIPVPAAASVNQNSLSRVAVSGMPNVNKMFTSIDMNNNSLNNVTQLDAVVINGATATLGATTIEVSLDVIPDATFRRNVEVVGKVKANTFEGQTLKINGGAEVGVLKTLGLAEVGSLKSLGDVNGLNVVSSNDIVAGNQIRAQSAIISGGIVGDSAKFRVGDFESATVSTAIVENMLSVRGASEFYQDALFKGSVMINGALTVKGIASALDIREGGILLKDKYSQLALANTFTQNNTFMKGIAANGGITVDGKQVISADGNTLYEAGTALDNKYLGKTDKAVSAINADKLGNVAASLYARRNADNTYSGKGIFNNYLYANSGVIVDGKWAISADGNNLYEGGTALSAKYLGKNAKAVSAVNADKLGNVAASLYARRNANNSMTGVNTFSQSIAANGGLKVDGKQVISADGNTLYEGGVALSSKYLGKTAKAASAVTADKLANVAASNYARTDIEETFTKKVNVYGGLHVKSDWVRVDGKTGIYFQSYGGGWNMTDTTWIKAYGGKSIYSSGVIQADGGLKVDGKWIASSNGATLYENGTALSSKYLGKTAKAVSAVTADKLGNIAASLYARKDISNTFTKSQTFNGGLSTTGVSSSGNIYGRDIFFKDGSVNRSLSSVYNLAKAANTRSSSNLTKINSLEAWKAACRRDASSSACGIKLSNGGGGALGVVWTGSTKSGVPITWGSGAYTLKTGSKNITLYASSAKTCNEAAGEGIRAFCTSGKFKMSYYVTSSGWAGWVDSPLERITKIL